MEWLLPQTVDTQLPKAWDVIPRAPCVDIHGLVDMWAWAWRVAFGTDDLSHTGFHSLGNISGPLADLRRGLAPGYEFQAIEISARSKDYGICPNRIWNISLQSPRGVADISSILRVATNMPLVGSKVEHEECTDQHCLHSQDNSTIKVQSHKCQTGNSGACRDEMRFPSTSLNDLFGRQAEISESPTWQNTAWRRRTRQDDVPAVCKPDDGYIAISHVWSDGTGVGLKSPGQVNACLYGYFSDIAARLDCDGIWWDAISIPTERNARRIAINSMLENFERAKVTVVHDQHLVNFQWKDDGTPAVALVLSSWFTRGWTAGELFASRNHAVKVLFADPDDPAGPPLLKDLDEDILARDPKSSDRESFYMNVYPKGIYNKAGSAVHPGHFVATDIIRILRPIAPDTYEDSENGHTWEAGTPTKDDLRSLLRILRPRTTSWPKDRTIIAGLLSLSPEEFASARTEPDLTKRILSMFGRVDITDLIHGEIPITRAGPWSWCPQSIFSMGRFNSEMSSWCSVNLSGHASGRFAAFEVLDNDDIIPYGSHPSLVSRVSAALYQRHRCLLLTTTLLQESRLYILCKPCFVRRQFIHCSWVGCVFLQSRTSVQPAGDPEANHPSGRKRIRSMTPWEELAFKFAGDVVRDIPQVSVNDIEYGFGEDLGDNKQPLPAMSFDCAELAIDDSQERPTDDFVYRRLSANSDDGLSKDDWLPQPVYFYNISEDPRAMCSETDYRIHPTASLVFDIQTMENKIKTDFLEELLLTVRGGAQAYCPQRHHFRCQGTVVLAWSFPHRPMYAYEVEVYERRIYRSTFHVVEAPQSPNERHEVSLGKITVEEDIRPDLKFSESRGFLVNVGKLVEFSGKFCL
ncbi:hypothetical protein NUW58_g7456 [Xylaria curta]|uniref:Uncharacterized protein n=1 Tax=Xylaria curta TaxID=42375 RepID=A0ACC1NJF7_9PEZI|nr:hypothetical protein NUW58_g7456 [Xylaria curta]